MAGDVIPAAKKFTLYSPIERIKKHVAAFYGLTVSDLNSPRRQRALSHPRHVAMYLCREFSPQSFPRIGEQFGGRDHTTVMHALKAVEERISQDPELRRQIDILRQVIEKDIGNLVDDESQFLADAVADRTREAIREGLRRLLEMDAATFSAALLPVVMEVAARETKDEKKSPIREVV